MTIIERGEFEDSTEVIDGVEYRACEFRRCTLVYRGGPLPTLIQCHFSHCRWEFDEAAARTLALLHGVYHGIHGGRQIVEDFIAEIKRTP
jgi:hypothetical protein